MEISVGGLQTYIGSGTRRDSELARRHLIWREGLHNANLLRAANYTEEQPIHVNSLAWHE
jgi:hypothetical protein